MHLKKLRTMLACMLAVLMFAMPALAEVPEVGTLTDTLTQAALAGGRELQYEIAVNADGLLDMLIGAIPADEKETQEQNQREMDAVKKLLETTKITGTFVQKDDAFRLTFALIMQDQSALAGTILFLDDTFYITSDLTGGKTLAMTTDEVIAKVTGLAKVWMADSGMSMAEIESAFKVATDPAAELDEKSAAQIEALMSKGYTYVGAVAGWAEEVWAPEVTTGEIEVTAELKAAKQEQVTITAENVQSLLQRLCDLLAADQDALNEIVKMAGENATYTTDELSRLLRAYPVQSKRDLQKSMQPMTFRMFYDVQGELIGVHFDWKVAEVSVEFDLTNDAKEDGDEVQLHFNFSDAEENEFAYDMIVRTDPVVATEQSNAQRMTAMYAYNMKMDGQETHMVADLDRQVETSENTETTRENLMMKMPMTEDGAEMLEMWMEIESKTEKQGDDFTVLMTEKAYMQDEKTPMVAYQMTIKSREAAAFEAPADAIWYARLTEEEQEALKEELYTDMVVAFSSILSYLPEEMAEMIDAA
ncbi:MAG: hypothetical protein RR482_03735 [Clostridia bacterium]